MKVSHKISDTMREMMPKMVTSLFILCFLFVSNQSYAQENIKIDSDILNNKKFLSDIKEWSQKPVVLISLMAQNKDNQNRTMDHIKALDKIWRDQLQSKNKTVIVSKNKNPLSGYLSYIQSNSGGLYTSISIMDEKGLNVAQSVTTEDYWQGDEAKYQKTYALGSDAIYIDKAVFHEETQTWRAEFSLTLTEKNDSKPLGAMTVEVNLNEFQRRESLLR